jgi:hypothetical protein
MFNINRGYETLKHQVNTSRNIKQYSISHGYLKMIWEHIMTFGNPPVLRARSSLREPVEMTDARLVRENRSKHRLDSLSKSLAS